MWLKELDHCFSLFLDEVWFTTRLIRLHGRTIPSSLRIGDRFADETNVAKKLGRVAQELNIAIEMSGFESLSLARNALTHGAGIVGERHVNRANALEVSWLAPEVVLLDGDTEIVFGTAAADQYQVKSENGADVVFRFALRSVTTLQGKRIRLEPRDLAEICVFYHMTAMRVVEKLKEKTLATGIPPDAA